MTWQWINSTYCILLNHCTDWIIIPSLVYTLPPSIPSLHVHKHHLPPLFQHSNNLFFCAPLSFLVAHSYVAIWATLDIYNVEQSIGTCLTQALDSLQGSPINNKVSLPAVAKFQFLDDNYQVPCEGYACKGATKVSRVRFTMSVPGDEWIPGAAARLARVVNNGHLVTNLTSLCGYNVDVLIPIGGLNLYDPPPTSMPTSRPSVSFTPTSHPSGQPSHFPSTIPSTCPSMSPSMQPTALPSSEPSAQPSIQVGHNHYLHYLISCYWYCCSYFFERIFFINISSSSSFFSHFYFLFPLFFVHHNVNHFSYHFLRSFVLTLHGHGCRQ